MSDTLTVPGNETISAEALRDIVRRVYSSIKADSDHTRIFGQDVLNGNTDRMTVFTGFKTADFQEQRFMPRIMAALESGDLDANLEKA